ncbi:MAG: hypothetical protein C5B58_05820 [Acidobacteria bacterium]|nr:MAG: hypothetical protein C5B58_05820 [Acidobacteriota bacterium]
MSDGGWPRQGSNDYEDVRSKVVMESILETKASTLLEFFAGLRGSLFVTFEEGAWAAWLYKPHDRGYGVQSTQDPTAQTGQTRVTRSMLANWPSGCPCMILSPCTMAKPGYVCCANWPEVI